jgi:DDE superfamily endonuclease/Helix-turn-helix of DDE superfamily endonuclease
MASLTYRFLVKRPSAFYSFSGITVREFDELYAKVEPLWLAAKQEQLSRPNRQRAIGAGNQYRLTVADQLMMTLIWLHLYLNTETLGFLFDVSKSTISRNSRQMLDVLRQVGEDTLDWQEPPSKGRGRSLQEVKESHPDVAIIIDVMEQRIQRPQGAQKQNAHYSGKQKAHTRKTGLMVNERGIIRGVTATYPGRTHDLTLFRTSNLLRRVPHTVPIIGDKAFDGMHHDLPNHSVATPYKARRKRPLDESERWANRDLSRQRIVVENTICELRHFNILFHRFRHSLELTDLVVRAVIALVNPRIVRRNTVAGLA